MAAKLDWTACLHRNSIYQHQISFVMLCHVFSALTLLAGRHKEQQMPLHLQITSTLASFKPSLVLPFWYRLMLDVLKKRLLTGVVVVAVVLVVCLVVLCRELRV